MSGSMEESVVEMYLQGVSTRKIEQITGRLSGVKVSKDAVSRITARFDEAFSGWRTRQLDKTRSYPYLYLDATYLRARWAGAVRDVALLVAVGVSDEGHREVLAVEAAGERSESWRGVLQGLVERGLRGVKLVISDDHEAIKHAVQVELSGAAWQRCTVHFADRLSAAVRNILAHVSQAETREVAADLKPIFQAARRQTAEQLAASFTERYGKVYPKAVATLTRGLDEALTPPASAGRDTAFPSSHHRLIRTTSGLERVFREVKRRTRVVGVFPSQESAETLATAVLLRASEDWCLRKYLDIWCLRKYLDMTPLHALFHQPTRFAI